MFTSNLFLLIKELILLSMLRSWGAYERKWEENTLTNDGTRHGFSTTTMHHAGFQTRWFLASNKITVVAHPPYSPDLPHCDFLLFPILKKEADGVKAVQETIQAESQAVLNILGENDFQECFRKLQHHWIICQHSGRENFQRLR